MINIFKVKKKQLSLLVIIIVLTEAAGFISGYLGMASKSTYENLAKPFFSPPWWLFPIVWSILYLLMGLALYRILLREKEGKNISRAKRYYFIQLGINLLWTFIFFRFGLYGLAFLNILFMLVFILLTIFELFIIDKISAFLLIPYIIWISFAGILNFYIWVFNEM